MAGFSKPARSRALTHERPSRLLSVFEVLTTNAQRSQGERDGRGPPETDSSARMGYELCKISRRCQTASLYRQRGKTCVAVGVSPGQPSTNRCYDTALYEVESPVITCGFWHWGRICSTWKAYLRWKTRGFPVSRETRAWSRLRCA